MSLDLRKVVLPCILIASVFAGEFTSPGVVAQARRMEGELSSVRVREYLHVANGHCWKRWSIGGRRRCCPD